MLLKLHIPHSSGNPDFRSLACYNGDVPVLINVGTTIAKTKEDLRQDNGTRSHDSPITQSLKYQMAPSPCN